MKLYLIRHGMPDYHNDTLTEEGKEQAKKLGQFYKDYPFDKIYCSTHGRAIETAKYLAKPHQMEVIPQDWPREDTGANYFACLDKNNNFQWMFWQPDYIEIFKNNDTLSYGKEWYENPTLKNTKLKEGYELMARGLDTFFEELGLRHDRERNRYDKIGELPDNVALVAHGGFAFSFLSNMLDIPYGIFCTTFQCLDLTSVTIIDFVEVNGHYYPRIKVYNDTRHLDGNDIDEEMFAGI